MPGTYSQKHYIHIDLDHNELRNAIAGSGSYLLRPQPNGIADKGLFYYDQYINHLMIWDGTTWKISKKLDDGRYVSTDNLLMDNIWTQTYLIPNNPGNTISAINPGITSYLTITLSHITGSYTFTDYSSQLKDVVPTKFGSTYEPLVLDAYGVPLSTGFLNYKIEGDNITFYDGFTFSPRKISPTQSPAVSFIKYTGAKGVFQFLTGDLTNINIIPVTPPYNVLPFGFTYSATPSNVNTLLFINGVSEFDWIFSNTMSTITLITASLQYDIESDDKIVIHYRPS